MLKDVIWCGIFRVVCSFHDKKGDVVSIRLQIGEYPFGSFRFFVGFFPIDASKNTEDNCEREKFVHFKMLYPQSTTNGKDRKILLAYFNTVSKSYFWWIMVLPMDFAKYSLIAFLFMIFFNCKQEKKYHDAVQKDVVFEKTDALADVLNFQKELNDEFKNPETSPLPDRFRKDFEGLEFFKPDTAYVVKAKFIRTPEAIPFMMPTTTNRESEETVYGIAEFTLNGKNHKLEVYQNRELMKKEGYEDYLFLPFADETNGEETYTGGRYIDLKIPDSDTLIIDFNRAYNPYCVYNKKYSCPLVPGVNALNTKILAGVKDFSKGKE